jgi:predicted glycoside hydrolase/deacetylase ChbG (UPF0249 family)
MLYGICGVTGKLNMKCMITADDFGYSLDTYLETIRLYEVGMLNNISIMPNMPETKKALAFASVENKASYGVHLTFCRDSIESPLLSDVDSLVDKNGIFYLGRDAQFRALFSRFSVTEIEREMRAQLDVVANHVDISYVDSHMHLHKYPVFMCVLKKVLPEYGIKYVRAPQNVFLPGDGISLTRILSKKWNTLLRQSFHSTHHFYMAGGNKSFMPLVDLGLDGVVEIGFHPGREEEWKREETENTMAFFDSYNKVVSWVDWRDI